MAKRIYPTHVVPKGARVTGMERDQMIRSLRGKYERGKSIRDLAIEYGRSYGFIHRLLSESDVELRRRGGYNRKTKAPA